MPRKPKTRPVVDMVEIREQTRKQKELLEQKEQAKKQFLDRIQQFVGEYFESSLKQCYEDSKITEEEHLSTTDKYSLMEDMVRDLKKVDPWIMSKIESDTRGYRVSNWIVSYVKDWIEEGFEEEEYGEGEE